MSKKPTRLRGIRKWLAVSRLGTPMEVPNGMDQVATRKALSIALERHHSNTMHAEAIMDCDKVRITLACNHELTHPLQDGLRICAGCGVWFIPLISTPIETCVPSPGADHAQTPDAAPVPSRRPLRP